MQKLIAISLAAAALAALLVLSFALAACSNGDTPSLTGTAEVAFDLGYTGASAISPITVESGTAAGTAWPANPARLGYTFDGWYAGGTAYTAQTVITGDTALRRNGRRRSPGLRIKFPPRHWRRYSTITFPLNFPIPGKSGATKIPCLPAISARIPTY